MAAGITKYGASYVLDVMFGGRRTAPEAYYVALLTAAPGEHADGTQLLEPDIASGYSRIPLLNHPLTFGSATNGVLATTASVVYPTATEDWPVITHYALCDELVGGNVYLYGAFTQPRRVLEGDEARIAANSLSLAVTSPSTAFHSAF